MSDQPHGFALVGQEPVATIDRHELKDKLDHKAPIKLVMALNRWAFDAKHIPGSLDLIVLTSSTPRSARTMRLSSIARTSIAFQASRCTERSSSAATATYVDTREA